MIQAPARPSAVILKEPLATEGSQGILRYAQDDKVGLILTNFNLSPNPPPVIARSHAVALAKAGDAAIQNIKLQRAQRSQSFYIIPLRNSALPLRSLRLNSLVRPVSRLEFTPDLIRGRDDKVELILTKINPRRKKHAKRTRQIHPSASKNAERTEQNNILKNWESEIFLR